MSQINTTNNYDRALAKWQVRMALRIGQKTAPKTVTKDYVFRLRVYPDGRRELFVHDDPREEFLGT